MRAVFSGVSTVMLLLGAVFWLGDEWRWLMDFLLQLFLFCLLGKFILVPAYFWATTFRSAQTLSLSLSLVVYSVPLGESPRLSAWAFFIGK